MDFAGSIARDHYPALYHRIDCTEHHRQPAQGSAEFLLYRDGNRLIGAPYLYRHIPARPDGPCHRSRVPARHHPRPAGTWSRTAAAPFGETANDSDRRAYPLYRRHLARCHPDLFASGHLNGKFKFPERADLRFLVKYLALYPVHTDQYVRANSDTMDSGIP